MMNSPLGPDIGQPNYRNANFHNYGWIVFLTVVGAVFYASYASGHLITGWVIILLLNATIPLVLAVSDQIDFIVDRGNERQFTVDAKAARNVWRNRQMRTTILKGCLAAFLIPAGLMLIIFVVLEGPADWSAWFTSKETIGMMPLLGVIGVIDLLFLSVRNSIDTDPGNLWVELRDGILLIPKGRSKKQAIPVKDIRSVIWCEGTSSDQLRVMVVPEDGYRIDFLQDQVKDEKALKEAFGEKLRSGDGMNLLMQEVAKMSRERQ
jgi:hypothetical protein